MKSLRRIIGVKPQWMFPEIRLFYTLYPYLWVLYCYLHRHLYMDTPKQNILKIIKSKCYFYYHIILTSNKSIIFYLIKNVRGTSMFTCRWSTKVAVDIKSNMFIDVF